jgi:hypothetical protein
MVMMRTTVPLPTAFFNTNVLFKVVIYSKLILGTYSNLNFSPSTSIATKRGNILDIAEHSFIRQVMSGRPPVSGRPAV